MTFLAIRGWADAHRLRLQHELKHSVLDTSIIKYTVRHTAFFTSICSWSAPKKQPLQQ